MTCCEPASPAVREWEGAVRRDSDNTIPLDPLVVNALCGPEPAAMQRFRRKPDPCLAAQWFPDGPPLPGVGPYPFGSETVPAVKTAAGWHLLKPGQWVVRFSDGIWAVFGDDYFRATFEPAGD